MTDRRFDPASAEKLDAPERAEWQRPEEVLDRLGVAPGYVVADVGAGSGFWVERIARRAGAAGRVVAFDVQPAMLARLVERAQAGAGIAAPIHPVVAPAEVLPAAAGSFDRIFLANLWHELDDPAAVAAETRRVLRPGGRLAVLDWRPDRPHPPGPPPDHRIAAATAAEALETAGWTIEVVDTVGPYHWIVQARDAGAAVRQFFESFLESTGRDPGTPLLEAGPFGDGPELADSLADLVLRGVKTATSSLLAEHRAEGDPTPRPGDLSVVTDWHGGPLCVIETTEAGIRPFDEVDADFAAAEGEGDRTLESWRAGHARFFARVCDRMGLEFSKRMEVVAHRFRVVF